MADQPRDPTGDDVRSHLHNAQQMLRIAGDDLRAIDARISAALQLLQPATSPPTTIGETVRPTPIAEFTIDADDFVVAGTGPGAKARGDENPGQWRRGLHTDGEEYSVYNSQGESVLHVTVYGTAAAQFDHALTVALRDLLDRLDPLGG